MLENPIPTVDFGNELPSGFIDEVAKKMKQQSQFGAGAQQVTQQPTQQPTQQQPIQEQRNPQQSSVLNEDLKSFIKQTIVEALDDVVDSKIQKIMAGNKHIDENLEIRVGDSMFIGKLTDVRKI